MKELILLAIIGMNPIVKYIFLGVLIAINITLVVFMIWSLLPHKIDKVEDNTDKFIKDHINKGSVEYIMTEERMKLLKDHLDNNTHKDPIPISGKALLRGFDPKGKEFIAKAKNCTLRFEQPSEEQQELIEESKKKMDKIMDESMIRVNAALTEYVHQFKTYPNNIEIKLILDNKVVDKTTTHFNFSVQPILISE